MNDQDRFIWNVTTPFLPDQADNWGWPHEKIEEVRLDRDLTYRRFSAGVAAAIGPARETFRTTNVAAHLYYDMSYDLQHTIPFVCDQVLTYPRNINVALVGARAEFITHFAKAWKAMEFSNPIMVPADYDDLRIEMAGVEAIPFAEMLARADIFLFEFGLASQRVNDPVRAGRRANAQDKQRLKIVERLFRHAVAVEARTRPRGRHQQRRFIGINVIYNKYWPMFTDHVSANISPFCNQVLGGYPRIDNSLKGKIRHLRGLCMV